MKKNLTTVLIILLAVPAFSVAADLSKVKFGGEIRMRGYNLQNMWDFDDNNDADNWSVFRHRTSVYSRIDLESNITGYIKITNQNFGAGVTKQSADKWEEENKSNKFFVDNAYINVKNIFDLPMSLKFGRQNLIYGSGFVLFDGQSQFASTSIYFDGIKFGWHIHNKVTLDFLYFKDEENNRDNKSDDDITLCGLYATAKCPLTGGKREAYILTRNDENKDKNIIMYGIRLSHKFDFGLDYFAECAIQKGDFTETIKQDALGYQLNLGYTFKNLFAKPAIFMGYVSLSGDASNTATKNEAWDVFYGGWPQYGDLLAWKYVNIGAGNSISYYDPDYNSGSSTSGEAVYSNFNMASIGLSASPLQNFSAKFSYSKIIIDETTGNIDNDFGGYYQLSADYKYSKQLSFSFYTAMIEPGAAFGHNTDNAIEIYWEVKLAF